MLSDIIQIRHELHSHPSLSGAESYAHDVVVSFLEKLHPTHLFRHVGGYGVVALFGHAEEGCIALRADMDALPIQEDLPIAYASCQAGVSHKCGHDGHTAVLLAVAERIAHQPLPHAVMLLFQPSEETGEGSTRLLASEPFLRFQPEAVFGLHNIPGYPCGQLLFKKGTFAAASVGWVLRLKGRQTHAAFPEKGINPGAAVAEIIQKMAAGNQSPEEEARFHQATLIYARIGEVAFGTSAGDAEVMFTLRAFTNVEMEAWKAYAVDLAEQVALRYGLSLSMEWKEPFRATENHADAVDRLIQVAERYEMEYAMLPHPFRWSEDFSEYLLRYPGAFFGIGSGESTPELHHPAFDFPDAVIAPAAAFFERLVKSY